MKRHQLNPWIQCFLFIILIVIGIGSLPYFTEHIHAEDHVVKDNPNAIVKQNEERDVDTNDLEHTVAERKPFNGGFRFESVTFKPPSPWFFMAFPDGLRYEHLPSNAEGLPYTQLHNESDLIQLAWAEVDVTSANSWNRIIEGNLDKPRRGPGTGSITLAHWGSLIRDWGVEIQVHNTETQDDDYVQIHSKFPDNRYTDPVRIRLVGEVGEDVEVKIYSENGRLRFPEAESKVVTLPANGDWVEFEVSGETGSAKLNDAVIRVETNSENPVPLGQEDMTVFYFDQAKMDVQTIGLSGYGIHPGTKDFFPLDGIPVASYKMEARIRPKGVDCDAPQVKDIVIGMVQNAISVEVESTVGNPTIDNLAGWAPGTHTEITVPLSITEITVVEDRTNDSVDSGAPIYDGTSTRPKGCKGGGTAMTQDNPNIRGKFSLSARLPDGRQGAIVVYELVSVPKFKMDFLSWCVAYNTQTGDVSALLQRPWNIDVFAPSNPNDPQLATSGDAGPPTFTPITKKPFTNTQLNSGEFTTIESSVEAITIQR